MADKASVFHTTQIGVESTSGSQVTANKQLLSMSFDVTPTINVKSFRPSGIKYPTIAAPGKKFADVKIAGQPTFDEMTYVFAGALSSGSVTSGSGTSQSWVYTVDSDGPDTRKTYTVEQGDSIRAFSFTYLAFSEVGMTGTPDEVTLKASAKGSFIEDDITMSGSPTSIAQIPILPNYYSIYVADAGSALASTSPLTRVLSWDWDLADIQGELFTVNRANNSSFASMVELAPKGVIKITQEADDEGMALLANAEAGSTKFIRIEAVGPVIAGAVTYKLTSDFACKVESIGAYKDQDGVAAIDWTLGIYHDATWGKSQVHTLVNTTASL